MKRLLPALLLLSPLAHAQVDTEIRCLVSAGAKPIRLEWRQYNDSTGHFSSTFVRYAHSDKPITLVLKSSRGEELAEGRPWQFDTTWVEVIDGTITGQYHMLSQGARIYGFDYRNLRNGKTFDFDEALDIETSPEKGCQWPTP